MEIKIRILIFLIGFGILYLTGWNILAGGELKIVLNNISKLPGLSNYAWLSYEDIIFNTFNYNIKNMNYFFSGDLIVVKVNNLYYGLFNNHRFFNFGIIEWAGLGVGIITIIQAVFNIKKNIFAKILMKK